MKPKLFVPNHFTYAEPFLPIFDIADTVAECDVVLFTGGEDIDPAFYGEQRGRFTDQVTARSAYEKGIFHEAMDAKKKFLGICRGAQLLCAMAGGKLAQHVKNHYMGFTNYHPTRTSIGKTILMNSVHHQMMIPWGIPHELLAWTEKRSNIYLNGKNENIQGIEVDPEVVYFPTVNGLGIQCHPEYGYHHRGPAMEYFHNLVKEKLLND